MTTRPSEGTDPDSLRQKTIRVLKLAIETRLLEPQDVAELLGLLLAQLVEVRTERKIEDAESE